MVSSFVGVFAVTAAVTAAVTVVITVVRIVQARRRVSAIRERHEGFGQRFKQSGFADFGGPAMDASTHPMPLQRVADRTTAPVPSDNRGMRSHQI